MVQLTKKEWKELITNCDNLTKTELTMKKKDSCPKLLAIANLKIYLVFKTNKLFNKNSGAIISHEFIF